MQEKVNKIIQADCLEYLRSLPDGCVECVLIDEPYMLLKGHKIEEGYNLDIAKQIRVEAMRVLKADGWFVFFSQFPVAWDFGRITMEAGFKPWQQCNEIVWCKRKPSSPFGKVIRIHENIFVFQKGSPKTYDNKAPYEDILVPQAFNGISSEAILCRYFAELKRQVKAGHFETKKIPSNSICNNDAQYTQYSRYEHISFQENAKLPSIWSFMGENRMHMNKHNIKHPTVKPTLLLRRLIKFFTQEGDTVLDCFSGSGTTALACKQEGRNFLCCERDPKYVKIANDRLANSQQDLIRQDKWLNERGVMDFEADAKVEKQDIQGSLF
jgi:DNA modification methylase